MTKNDEEKMLARGLRSPGVLLLVKKYLNKTGNRPRFMRIIVSNDVIVKELSGYFEKRGGKTETDRAGDDYHLIVDLSKFKDVD